MNWKMPLLAVAGAAIAAVAQAQTAFAPAAVVNDDPITYYEIEQRARLLALGANTPAGPELNSAALEQLIDDRLRMQAAEQAQVAASPSAISAAADELAGRQGISRDQFIEQIARGGVTEDTLIDLLRPQVAWRQLINGRFASRATPGDAEIDQEVLLASAGRTQSFRLSEIAIPAPEGRESQAEAIAQRVARELAAGASFASLAQRYSRSPSASNGGDVGWIPESRLPPDLAQAIGALQPGQVTQPIKVPGGVSFFKLENQRSEAPPWAQPAAVSMVRIALPLSENASAEEIAEAREQASELAGGTRSCTGLPDLGDALSEQVTTRPLTELPTNVQAAVQLLLPNQASRPVRSAGSMDVFVMCERSGGADAEARQQLSEQIRNTRLSRFSQGFLQELRRDAVIERR